MLKQTIIIHKNSETHKANKIEYLDVRHDDDAIKTIMSDHFLANPTLVMANLSPDTHLYRWRVCEVAMEEGIALNKVDALRSLLERGGE